MPASIVAVWRWVRSSAIWRSSAGATFCWVMARARPAQSPGDILLAGSPLNGFDQPAAVTGALQAAFHLGDGLVDQEGRRDESLAAGVADAAKLAFELDRVGLQARDIRLGVGC